MAHIYADGVVDTSTTTGTGALTVSGSAATGFQTFSAVCSTSDTFHYFVRSQSANEWEQGLGTYSGTNEITRTTVIASSNSNAAVNFSAGTKDVFITHPAARIANTAYLDTEDQTVAGGARVTSKSITAGSVTFDPGDRPLQYQTNSGAFTITAPSYDGSFVVMVTNDGSAGAITFSGFTVGSNVGDALTTTDTHKFKIYIDRINSVSSYAIQALQ